MKRLVSSAVLALLPCLAFAQLDLRCRLTHSHVVLFESIPVEVTIANNTGEPLKIGTHDANAVLVFDIERSPGEFLQPTGVSLWPGAVTVPPMGTLKQTVDLLSAYPVVNTGPYTVTGRLEWEDRVFVSTRMFLDVLPGLEVGRLAAAIPGMGRTVHTYSLRTLSRERSERLFLRIDDADDGRCYGVFNLGRVVRMYKPVMQTDEEGNVHVLHQMGPNQFVRHVFTPYGFLVSQEQYTGDGAQLSIDRRPGRGVVVEGLAERIPGVDDGAGGEIVEFEDLLR